MRVGTVIGTVTLSQGHPSMAGARFVIALPSSLKALVGGLPPDGEDLVVYDQLGAGVGAMIGFSEGGEAAAPFHPNKKPVDAYCALLIDKLIAHPMPGPGAGS
jgi:ethanolamine utilization protein EutN